MNSSRGTQREQIRLLLVEDDAQEREVILEELQQLTGRDQVVCVGLLREAVEWVEASSFDLILLDLRLPDGEGLEAFNRLHRQALEIPLVVITAHDDDEMAIQAVQAGAQDHLVKGQIGKELLQRSIRYSIERQRLLQRIEGERYGSDQQSENHALTRLAALSPLSVVTSYMYGRKPLKEAAPEVYDTMVEQYAALLEEALERQVLKREDGLGDEIRRLAEEMGFLLAGPKDVIDLHMQGLRSRCEDQPPSKVKALTEEGRFLMIELMGYLVTFYRDYYFGCVGAFKKADQDTVTREKIP